VAEKKRKYVIKQNKTSCKISDFAKVLENYRIVVVKLPCMKVKVSINMWHKVHRSGNEATCALGLVSGQFRVSSRKNILYD
jgi:hypothetical protein